MLADFHIGAKALLTKGSDVLLLRRGSSWDLPGGRIEVRESPVDALRRELCEELPGIEEIQVGELLGWYQADDYRVPGRDLFLVVFHATAKLPDPIVCSEEHDYSSWVAIEEASGIFSEIAVDWRRVASIGPRR